MALRCFYLKVIHFFVFNVDTIAEGQITDLTVIKWKCIMVKPLSPNENNVKLTRKQVPIPVDILKKNLEGTKVVQNSSAHPAFPQTRERKKVFWFRKDLFPQGEKPFDKNSRLCWKRRDLAMMKIKINKK